jgi:hypothetical protein
MATQKKFDSLGFIMAYEDGDLDENDIVAGFQCLIDSGMAWSLQGHYGRMAAALIKGGYCEEARKLNHATIQTGR